MKGHELRDMSVDELRLKERELTEQCFNLKFQHATGQLENTMALRKARRNIARVKTVLAQMGAQGMGA
jgi:large subunit ribosomal protein L29